MKKILKSMLLEFPSELKRLLCGRQCVKSKRMETQLECRVRTLNAFLFSDVGGIEYYSF